MKILIISLFYFPEPLKIFSDLAEGLSAKGHDVTVLTTFPNHPSGNIYSGYSNTIPKSEMINGVRVVRVPFFPSRSYSAIKRAFSYLSFMVMCCIFGPFIISRKDIIYTVEPPTSALAAWILSRFWRIPFVYEILDMWPETLEDTGMVSNRKVLGIVGRYCQYIYSKSAALRVISKGQKENLLKKGVSQDKIFLIPIWVDTDYYTPINYDSEMAEEIGAIGFINIIYTGNLGAAQGMQTVLSAAAELQDISKVQFFIFGDGIDGPLLRKKAYDMGLKNVKFMGSFPNNSMTRVCSIADCMLVHLRDMPAFRIAIPHKILSYLACGKPIIAALEGDGAVVIREANAGITCKPDDSLILAHTIRDFIDMTESERYSLGYNGRMAAITNYEKQHVIDKINHMLMQISHLYEL